MVFDLGFFRFTLKIQPMILSNLNTQWKKLNSKATLCHPVEFAKSSWTKLEWLPQSSRDPQGFYFGFIVKGTTCI